MPPIAKISKEDIINKAVNIARCENFNSINARRLAKELGCSVQPIFSNFKNMEELKNVVLSKICELFYETITKVEDSNISKYKQVGLNYIKFAKAEPNMFKLIFLGNNKCPMEEEFVNEKNNYYLKVYDLIENDTGLDKKKIPSFHLKMWIFTHGLATLVASKCTFTDEEINELLTSEFKALSQEEKEGKINEKNN